MVKRKAKPIQPIELDGRTLEGGGQLIRIALCLAALTHVPIKIDHIRGNRGGGGGLKSQHLACVNWLAHACNARVSGAAKGSKALVFEPGEVPGGISPAFKKRTLPDGGHAFECHLDIETAGSTGLALQAILPFILFNKIPSHLPVHLKISGGTNVSGSPSFDYIQHVLLPSLQRIGYPEIKISLGKRGWTHGGSSVGHFTLEIPPRPSAMLPAFRYRPSDTSLDPVPPSSLRAIILAPRSCHQHFTDSLLGAIRAHFGAAFPLGQDNLAIQHEDSHHEKRLYLLLIATIPSSSSSSSSSTSPISAQSSYILARDWLYDRKLPSSPSSSAYTKAATDMAEAVTKALQDEWKSGAWVDEHMRDQLVIFQALANGRSEVFPGWNSDEKDQLMEPSLHARTAEWVTRQLLGVRFDAEGSCEGVAFGVEADDDDQIADGVGSLKLDRLGA